MRGCFSCILFALLLFAASASAHESRPAYLQLTLDDAERVSISFKAPAVGNTVDAATANYTNTIGSPELATVWTDPGFDPEQEAFYYARVIEIPTPRWSTLEAFRFGMPIPDGAPVSTQERAYTSPIWYTP